MLYRIELQMHSISSLYQNINFIKIMICCFILQQLTQNLKIRFFYESYDIVINVKYFMNIEAIRRRYKQILQESDSESVDDQWESTYQRMQQERQNNILKQSNITNKVKNVNEGLSIIDMEKKLAQSINDIKDKDKQIQMLVNQNQSLKKQKQLISKQLESILISCDRHKTSMETSKHKIKQLQEEIVSLRGQIQSNNTEKQLMKERIRELQKINDNFRIESNKKIQQQLQLQNMQKRYEILNNENAQLKKTIYNQQIDKFNKNLQKKCNTSMSEKEKNYQLNISKNYVKCNKTIKQNNYSKNQHKLLTSPNINLVQNHPKKRNKTISFIYDNEMLKKKQRKSKIDKSMKASQTKKLSIFQPSNKNSVSCKKVHLQELDKQNKETSQKICSNFRTSILIEPSKIINNHYKIENYQRIKNSLNKCKQIILEFKRMVEMMQTQINNKNCHLTTLIRLSLWMCETLNKRIQVIYNMS